MQHSSLILFCNECGLANDQAADYCTSCQHPLVHIRDKLSLSPVSPVTVTPPPVLEVRPGPLSVANSRGKRVPLLRYTACDFRSGSILAGRFQIQEEVGRGGFSIVYRAVDLQPEAKRRLVAIKWIQLDQLSPRQAIDATETFNREVALLQRLKKMPGTATYYEHLADAKNWYLITQYIKGQTLEAYLQKAPGSHIPEREVCGLGANLIEILQKLHTNEPSVIFRDLKPSNIMLTPQGTLYLIDFGIARFFTPGKTKDTTPLGSPGYAPPEQYGHAQTDQRSDIYSLGATLQTLLTGRDPLELKEGEPSRNHQAISPKLRELLDEMLALEADQRPADLAQIKRRLELIQNSPLMTAMMGAVFGAVLGIFTLFTLFEPISPNWIGYATLVIAVFVETAVRSKLKLSLQTPKGLRRFWWLGMPLGMLPFILWHIFFG